MDRPINSFLPIKDFSRCSEQNPLIFRAYGSKIASCGNANRVA